ncbi:hypothetical protein GH714_014110 [Hevea brasiliensis]|uniref:Uncharacterized protein n=1 Tax=Hevea brasiliensis TaxID=3981 RepID=A0A6A6KR10_HEVBR|nr:hypothetical protein GH714_014110 [Hevea brasiliensis]
MATLFSSSLFEILHPTHYRYRVSLSSPPENQDNDRFSGPAMITLIFHRFDVYQRYVQSLNVHRPELPVPREQRFVHVPACDYAESAEGPECEIMTAMGIPPNIVKQVGCEVRRACSGTDVSIFADIYIAQVHQQEIAYDDDDAYVNDHFMEHVGTIPASRASIDGYKTKVAVVQPPLSALPLPDAHRAAPTLSLLRQLCALTSDHPQINLCS